MKKTIKGICYDTAASQRLCTMSFPSADQKVTETVYRTTSGYYFIVQLVDGNAPILFPCTPQDITRWTEQHMKSPHKPWAG